MPPEEMSLRDALEKAYDDTERTESAGSSEAGGSPENTEEPVRTTAPTEKSEPTTESVASDDTGTKTTDDPAAKPVVEEKAAAESKPDPNDKPPESWKPSAREFWQKLPPEARAEVRRREADINQFVQQTAAKRKIADQFVETVSPYMGMIQSEGGNPISMVQDLLNTATFLRTGPPVQKAILVAKLVKDFGINIQDLDAALAGEQIPEDPNAKIMQILDQRLAPVNQLLQTVEQQRVQRDQSVSLEMDNEIAAFATDPKNEFFMDVKDEMADLVEMAAKRGRPITLQQAYDRAVAMDTEIQSAIRARVAAKKNAGGSLPQRGPSTGAPDATNRSIRGDIEAAFDTLATRA